MGFLIQLVLGQCMAGLGFMGLWQIQATLTLLAYDFNSDISHIIMVEHLMFSVIVLRIGESDLVTASVLVLYGTIENNKIVIFFFLNK